MSKGVPNARYTGDFKCQVVEDIQKNKLSQNQASAKYEVQRSVIARWERIYLEEGAQGLYIERRGRASAASGTQKGRPTKLPKQVEEDLITENQRLRAENDYLKNLHALVSERQQREKKHK